MTAETPRAAHVGTSSESVAELDGRDFMVHGYDLIKEPLNLLSIGQRWFRRVYEHERRRKAATALLLGATPWMCRLLCKRHQRVVVVDASDRMLVSLRQSLPRVGRQEQDGSAKVECISANWLELPPLREPPDVVLGDNSFSFLPFPHGWRALSRHLADRMAPSAKVFARVCSVPATHQRRAIVDLVHQFLDRPAINETELRAGLIFNEWDRSTYAIDTEKVLEAFEANRPLFDHVSDKFHLGSENDLRTVEKYRGAGAVYYAPPLADALSLFSEYFRVASVHFGPYAMAQYFPLIVASRE